MTLYLHCGYHKTASSYLQSCFTSQFSLLLKHGIYFPDDPRKAKVLRGEPTAGNGDPLCQALLKKDLAKSRKLLQTYREAARKSGVEAVFLSTEGFFTCFALPEVTAIFKEAVHLEGFDSLKGLIFFRDPVEHAISVYCHRSPSGKLPAFEPWLEKGFETPTRMQTFAENLGSTSVEWQIRKFQPKVKDIVSICFSDWLQIPEQPDLKSVASEINVSVTLSEAEMIRDCHRKFPGCGRYVGKALKTLPRSQKPDETPVRQRCNHEAALFFKQHSGVVKAINGLLPADEQLFVPKVVLEDVPQAVPTFSSAQVTACASGILAFQESRTPMGRFKRYLNRTSEQIQSLVSVE